MIIFISMLFLVLGILFMYTGVYYDSECRFISGLCITVCSIIFGLLVIGVMYPISTIQNVDIDPINIYKTNYETIITFRKLNGELSVLTSTDAEIFNSSNITIKTSTSYNSYNQPICNVYDVLSKK